MKITINNKEYILLIDYQKDDDYRAAFNYLAQKVFGISFETWYQLGYWNDKYIPYTLFDKGKAVANVSVNIMDFDTFGERKRYIQIGTVMTDEAYRNKQLSRFLMEKILTEWESKCDFIYLYANRSVLTMYPKFGFTHAKEYEYFKPIDKNIKHGTCAKLNMDMQSNRDRLYDYAKNSTVFSNLSMQENADLVMFYCASFLKDNVYFIAGLDIIAVAKFDGSQLHLFDIFGKSETDLDKIIYSLINPDMEQIVLGFTPKDDASYNVREVSGDDILFVQQNKTQLFDENKIIFPLLSHA